MTEKFFSKDNIVLSFVISGVLIGMIMAAQLKSDVVANSYIVDEINAQKELLKSFDEDRELVRKKIEVLRGQIEEKRLALAKNADQNLVDELNQFKDVLGLSKINGEGLEIILTDGAGQTDSDRGIIHAADLRDVVNLIRTTKPDGIAINGKRLGLQSTINTVGNVIMVNKSRLSSPFSISVVGDSQLISSRFSDSESYPDLYKRIREGKVKFETKKVAEMVLPATDLEYSLNSTNAQK